MDDFPRIISVDDHVIEPPGVWQDRLPEKFKDRGPRMVRDTAEFTFLGGKFDFRRGVEGAPACDWWLYDDLEYPTPRLSAAVGFDRDEVTLEPITLDEMRKGCWDVKARIEDMAMNHVDGSLCFPSFPRFCGQTFMERDDKELADLCVKAYNDWMIDEWCGTSDGFLLPLIIIQLWDPEAAADEVRRGAARGCRAVCFSEQPAALGLPSIHDEDRHWDPFFAACEETGTVICMHIGSSSKMPSTSADAPPAVGSSLVYANAQGALMDWLFCGAFVRFPQLKIAFSEGQIGWMPYALERADKVWEHNRGWAGVADQVPEPPSTYVAGHVYGCIFDDEHGLDNRHKIGMDMITFETDYPHSDSTWPHTLEVAKKITSAADMSGDEIHKLMRGNAIEMLGLDRA